MSQIRSWDDDDEAVKGALGAPAEAVHDDPDPKNTAGHKGGSPSKGAETSSPGPAVDAPEMGSILEQDPQGSQAALEMRVPEVSRRRLVLPVITILLISFLSIFAFLWTTAHSLNSKATARDRQLASSLLTSQLLTLEALARDHTTGPEARNYLGEAFDPAWADENIGQRTALASDITSAWIITGQSETKVGYVNGQKSAEGAFAMFPNGLDLLVSRAREIGDDQRRAVRGYLLSGGEIHMVAVSPIQGSPVAASDGGQPDEVSVLVLTKALDEGYLLRSGVNFTLAGLTISRAPPLDGYQGIMIQNPARQGLGYLVWQAEQPGDDLIWPLSPALGTALIAIGYFLYLFVRSADLFMERQAYLAASLQHEQNLRNLKTRFVAMVSHELRTPLAAIRNAAELLERYGERMSAEEQAEETQVIHRSVDALAKLVDNVLVIGRSDWMSQKGPARPLDLPALCRQTWSETVHGKTARLLLSEEGPKRTFYGDVAALKALLSNLFSNAAKYSNGDVMVKIVTKSKSVTLRVTDFGMGIPREELATVFEPFRRAKNAEPMTGSGLGLSIARASVKSMGGKISVMSEEGRGTTFEVSFPQDRQAMKNKAKVEES